MIFWKTHHYFGWSSYIERPLYNHPVYSVKGIIDIQRERLEKIYSNSGIMKKPNSQRKKNRKNSNVIICVLLVDRYSHFVLKPKFFLSLKQNQMETKRRKVWKERWKRWKMKHTTYSDFRPIDSVVNFFFILPKNHKYRIQNRKTKKN